MLMGWRSDCVWRSYGCIGLRRSGCVPVPDVRYLPESVVIDDGHGVFDYGSVIVSVVCVGGVRMLVVLRLMGMVEGG